jgi:hypothetical protein
MVIHASVVANHAKRTAEVDAAFFLPFLAWRTAARRRLRARVDTAGLKCVAPGETGVDPSSSVIHTAAASLASGLSDGRLTFEVGDIYTSRFGDETFDAVFTHQVLQLCRGRLKL